MNIDLIKEKIEERDSERLKSKKILDEAKFLSDSHLDSANYSERVANNLLNAFTLQNTTIKKELFIVAIFGSQEETNTRNKDIMVLTDKSTFFYAIVDALNKEVILMDDAELEKELGIEFYSVVIKFIMKKQNSLVPEDSAVKGLLDTLSEITINSLEIKNEQRKASEN